MSSSRQMFHAARLAAGVFFFGLLLTPAWADFTGVALSITAANSAGARAEYLVEFSSPRTDSGEFRWTLPGPVALVDPTSHTVVAQLNRLRLHYIADPQIALDFSMQAGGLPTEFTVESALLPIDPPLQNPLARASAGINVTDFDGNGADLHEPNGGSVVVFRYNGPTWSTFAEGIQQIIVTEPFGSNGASFDAPPGGGYAVIPGAVSNMGERIHFIISANDFASGTSQYEIVPEPAGALLAALGCLVLRRR